MPGYAYGGGPFQHGEYDWLGAIPHDIWRLVRSSFSPVAGHVNCRAYQAVFLPHSSMASLLDDLDALEAMIHDDQKHLHRRLIVMAVIFVISLFGTTLLLCCGAGGDESEFLAFCSRFVPWDIKEVDISTDTEGRFLHWEAFRHWYVCLRCGVMDLSDCIRRCYIINGVLPSVARLV